MDAAFLALVVIVLVALAFDYTNGFHDAANAIAVAVSTKALTPRVALGLAAVMNLVGAVISTGVAARYLQRLSTRHPALVAPVATGAPRAYALTPAGRLELARLERRIPEAGEHAHGAPPL